MTTYAKNKKALFDYEILEKLEAGLVLTGQEVKSIRTGHVSLKGGFIHIQGDEAYLTNVHIPKYKFTGHAPDYNPERTRKILLHKKQINFLKGKSQEKGLTIVPISVYTKGRRIKIEIAVVRGKKKHDKRHSIKKRELDRETARAIKGNI
jgi:SsrA-binding protein